MKAYKKALIEKPWTDEYKTKKDKLLKQLNQSVVGVALEDTGETCLMLFAFGCEHNAIFALFSHGADIGAVDKQGNTALHWLARSNGPSEATVAIAKSLITQAARHNLYRFKNKAGDKAYRVAEQTNNIKLLDYLEFLEYGEIVAVQFRLSPVSRWEFIEWKLVDHTPDDDFEVDSREMDTFASVYEAFVLYFPREELIPPPDHKICCSIGGRPVTDFSVKIGTICGIQKLCVVDITLEKTSSSQTT